MKRYAFGLIMALGSLLATTRAHAVAHYKGTLSNVSLGARYSSLLERRGIVEYRDFQVDPVLSLFLFDDRFEIFGDSIDYRDFVYSDILRIRGRLASVGDKPFFPAYQSVRAGNPDRPGTYEASVRAELFLPGYNDNYRSEIDLAYAKDISVHHGNYWDLSGKLKLFQFREPVVGYLVEPNLYASFGWGDQAHNSYFYGAGASDWSFNNMSYGLWFAFPEDADRAFPIIQITRFEVLGDANRGASYAQGRNEGWLFSVIASFSVFNSWH